MKLRVRQIDSKRTLKIEVPTNCTIHQFKQTLSQFVSSPLSIHISLNRKDELLTAASGNNTNTLLSQLGVTSGDLIFYTLNPNLFRPPPTQTLILEENQSSQDKELVDSEMGMSQFEELQTLDQSPCVGVGGTKLLDSEIGVTNLDKSETLGDELEKHNMGDGDCVNSIDNMGINEGVESGSDSNKRVLSSSVPYLLRKVLKDELLNDCFDLRLMVISVHAVLLEYGFVMFDLVTGNGVDRLGSLEEWHSTSYTMSLWYTLPELIIGCESSSNNNNVIETIVLKFQSLGQFVNVYGSLRSNGTGLCKVCLDGNKFLPALYMVLGSSNLEVCGSKGYNQCSMYPEAELYEFWKIVKDGLALPLLIDICDRAGLPSPPCLMRLPTELKVKIFELLPGVDLANVGCVSSELRYLCSNNDMWKKKYVEEFGDKLEFGTVNWRERFASSWKSRKQRRTQIRYPHLGRSFYTPLMWRDPVPLLFPAFTGDNDFSRGLRSPFHLRQLGRGFPAQRNFMPNCNLGGMNT